jgi:hypothetical protein
MQTSIQIHMKRLQHQAAGARGSILESRTFARNLQLNEIASSIILAAFGKQFRSDAGWITAGSLLQEAGNLLHSPP